ncbi:uncharacterized protein N7511_010453 [Penicillium nucicola]|uniref:uncharacterized protein n=1 Tax=Penicillium nucicola TaxID=1850975 RepID=UPI0025456D5F|nr:uncharacterized protein N7511_010453 [Penicillium nucicola]KAJ5748757.1 hypothetical protein N7511_010453 [Penicillium nucicola]
MPLRLFEKMRAKRKPSTPDDVNEPNSDGDVRASWISLFGFTARRHLSFLIAAVAVALVASCVTPALAFFFGDLFDAFTSFGAGNIEVDLFRELIVQGIIPTVGLGAIAWFLNGGYYALFFAFGQLQSSVSRSRVFLTLLKKDVEWFEAKSEGSGAFLSRVQAHYDEMQTALSQPLGLVLQYSGRSIACFGLGLYTSWDLSLVTLAGSPFLVGIIMYLSWRIKSVIEAQQVELTNASKIANNAITNIDTVKCLNGQNSEGESFSEHIRRSATIYIRQARLYALQATFNQWMMFGMFVQGFWYGGYLAGTGRLSPGEVLRTFWACLTAAQSVEMILPQINVMEKGKIASAALKSIVRILASDRANDELNENRYPMYCKGDIEVRNVSFSYPSQPDQVVLKSSRFFFPAGKTTFVIGKSGSGKSTLSQLLMRFYQPTSGEIFIDQHPIKELELNWIRNNITLVEQKIVLFNDSVRANIVSGQNDHESVTMEDLNECIKLAMLEDTIDGLPKGIDTSVGPGGSFLSGGQRQRVAIARARLRDTPILILDEPTSALDHSNRVAVMKAIRTWREGKTTIIITHDMSHIMGYDYLYILEHGTIVDSGFRSGIEVKPVSEKYFGSNANEASSEMDQGTSGSDAEWENASSDIVQSPLPVRTRRHTRTSWARSDIPFVRFSMLPAIPNWNTTYSVDSREPARPVRDTQNRLSYANGAFENSSPEVNSDVGADAIEMTRMNVEGSSFDGHSHHHSLTSGSQLTPKNKIGSLFQVLKTVYPTMTPRHRMIFCVGFVAALLHASATPLFSYCLSQLLNTFYAGIDDGQLTMKWSLTVLGVAIGDGLASFFMHYFLEICGEAWMDVFRTNAFNRILDQPRAWFDMDGHGSLRLTSCLDQNVEDMRNLIGRYGGYMIVGAFLTVVAIVWSLIICWELTLVAIACSPVIVLASWGFKIVDDYWERRCKAANDVATDVFMETFSEIRTVRSLTLEGHFHRKHLKALEECRVLGFKRSIYSGMFFGLSEPMVIFATALIFWVGAELVAQGKYKVNDVMMVFSILLFSMGSVARILQWIPQINTAHEKAAQLIPLARLPHNVSHEHMDTLTVTKLTPIKLNHVYFRYPSRPRTTVLSDVSLTINANSCTAIVGRSGSGKSTIASLLVSFYEAPLSSNGEPSVTLGGEDILRLHVPSLRSQISIVSQQPTIFPGTIRENIIYGLDKFSRFTSSHCIHAAAVAAGVDEVISSLPLGYDTVIGDGGIGLSGGQKQRLVVARALVRQPQVLILDEATSSLDPAGAEVIRQTVQRLVAAREGLTVIIITHAKEMVEIADHVVVLDNGVVVEDGSYRVLSKRVGGKLYDLLCDHEDS